MSKSKIEEPMQIIDLSNEINIIENSHQKEILSIYENMQQLVYDCNAVEVKIDDKESYEKAVELKRLVKSVHVAIDKKRDAFKRPIIDYTKRFDSWVKTIYDPLVQAEKVVKSKLEIYEKYQDKIKQENKLKQEQENLRILQIDNKLKELNNQLFKINSAKNVDELMLIDDYLSNIVLSDFEDRSGEAGFIVNQLKMTLQMAINFKKQEQVKEQEQKEEKQFIETPSLNIPLEKELVKEKDSIVESKIENIVVNSIEENNDIINENKLTPPTDDDIIGAIDLISKVAYSKVNEVLEIYTKKFIESNAKFQVNNDVDYFKELKKAVASRVSTLLKNV